MTDHAAARAAIEARVAALETSWNTHDAEAFSAGFAEDADFTNVFGVSIEGRAAIAASHAIIFKTMFSESQTRLAPPRILFIRDDVASVDVRWTMTGARDPLGKPWPDRSGLLSMIMTQENGAWWFRVFHNQDLPPAEKVAEMVSAAQRRG
jgi:uncharacterized protein (TIGR02246 family)